MWKYVCWVSIAAERDPKTHDDRKCKEFFVISDYHAADSCTVSREYTLLNPATLPSLQQRYEYTYSFTTIVLRRIPGWRIFLWKYSWYNYVCTEGKSSSWSLSVEVKPEILSVTLAYVEILIRLTCACSVLFIRLSCCATVYSCIPMALSIGLYRSVVRYLQYLFCNMKI